MKAHIISENLGIYLFYGQGKVTDHTRIKWLS